MDRCRATVIATRRRSSRCPFLLMLDLIGFNSDPLLA